MRPRRFCLLQDDQTGAGEGEGGHIGLLGAVHSELRHSMRKLTIHCHLAARLIMRPVSRPLSYVVMQRSVNNGGGGGTILFSCYVVFQFPIHNFEIILT